VAVDSAQPTESNGHAVIIDGYVRVSKVGGRGGDRFIATAVQREQIRRWADAHGALVAHVFEELDQSGARADRPLLEHAIARVERGESEGIVVAYLSRFGRSVLDGLQAIKRITDAGGTFVSVLDGLDFSTDSGRMVLRFMFSVAEWELDRTRAGWAIATRRAVERGVSPAPAPFGYRRRASGRLAPDPVQGPIVAELFRLRANGVPVTALRAHLADMRIRSPHGDPLWNPTTLRRLLRRRTYLGEVRHGDAMTAEAHPALIDMDTWRRAQRPITRRAPTSGRPEPLLSGLLRCGSCQRLLSTSFRNPGLSNAQVIYGCGYRDPHTPRPCAAPATARDWVIECHVESLFWQALARRARPAPPDRQRLEEEVARRERELERYRDNPHLPTTLTDERFAAGLSIRLRRLESAERDLSQALVSCAAKKRTSGELRALWPTLSTDDKRAAMAEVIDCVFIGNGRAPIGARAHVCLRGTAPRDLPGRTNAWTPRPFNPGRSRRAQADVSARWSHARVRQELERLCAGRERWPSFGEFQAAGAAALYAQVELHGGQRSWASLLRVPFVACAPEVWSDGRIRAELQDFLEGETSWPTAGEFKSAGHDDLREAARAAGGFRRWADELGVSLATARRETQPWTYERMRTELEQFTRGRRDWPPRPEFAEAGLIPLYDAIRRRDARERLASDLGLRLPPGRRRVVKFWTEPRIDSVLGEFLRGRDTWPSTREFAAAGFGGLAAAIDDAGERKWWARRHGVRPRFRWFKPSIAAALDSFLEGREYWPSNREFAAAGLSDLRLALEARGDADAWRQRYGLRAPK
jgi:DNA invertase Pin-like site-specific DNA recombinase